MICPKCKEEEIVRVTLKMNQEKAYECNNCGVIWFEDEDIKTSTGHTYDVLTR